MKTLSIKKSAVINAVKAVSFLLVFAVLLSVTSRFFRPSDNTAKGGMNNPNAHGFYGESNNTIDVFVVGNSDAYSAFSPPELWHHYGITSYVSGEGHQRPVASVNMLREVLTCQKPRVAILEVDGLFEGGDRLKETVQWAAYGAFPVFQYHDRWKHFSLDEVRKKPKYTGRFFAKGQFLSNDVVPYEGEEYMIPTVTTAWIPWSSRVYLNAFLDVCRENDIQPLLMEVPSQTSWTYERHNAMVKYAEKHDVPFLDLDLAREEFDFDWTTDSRDGGNHLNNRGARKLTVYLGAYLQKTYALEDRRDDPAFDRWNKDYETYQKRTTI